MELAMEIFSNYQTIRCETVQDLKGFNSQSLSTQVQKRGQLVSMMPATEKAFNLLSDNIIDLSTEYDALKNRIGSYDQQWLEESAATY